MASNNDNLWILILMGIAGGIAIGVLVANKYASQKAQQAGADEMRAIQNFTPYALPAASAIMTNKETIEWKDWRGRDRTITIHREVR